MSFLNPVSEPVKRFSSTDPDAPQINYNARVAGDVKTVLKACLVTGYGTKASAGWSITNEVDHVAEFVSPSTAMSDYRLGIDDKTATKTDWYYQYQDARTNPSYNNPTKSFTYINKTHASNGWQLFATDRGIIFVELVQHTAVNKLSARITCWSALKSALIDTTGKNICFFNLGHNAAITIPFYFYSSTNYVHVNLSTNLGAYMSAVTSNALSSSDVTLDESSVDLVSSIYLANTSSKMLLAELPPILSKIVNKSTDLFGVEEYMLDGRSVLSVCAGFSTNTPQTPSRTFLIRTDFWEY